MGCKSRLLENDINTRQSDLGINNNRGGGMPLSQLDSSGSWSIMVLWEKSSVNSTTWVVGQVCWGTGCHGSQKLGSIRVWVEHPMDFSKQKHRLAELPVLQSAKIVTPNIDSSRPTIIRNQHYVMAKQASCWLAFGRKKVVFAPSEENTAVLSSQITPHPQAHVHTPWRNLKTCMLKKKIMQDMERIGSPGWSLT